MSASASGSPGWPLTSQNWRNAVPVSEAGNSRHSSSRLSSWLRPAMYASITRGVVSSSATPSASTLLDARAGTATARPAGARRTSARRSAGRSRPARAGRAASTCPRARRRAPRVRASTVVSGASRSSSWTRSASADSAGRASAAGGGCGRGAGHHDHPARRGGAGRIATWSTAASTLSWARRAAARRATRPCGLASRRIAPDTTASGTRLSRSSSSTVALGELDPRVRGLRHRQQVGRRERRQVPFDHHGAELARELGRRSSALASLAAPACSHARAISCSWRSCTTRVPAAAATRSRGSRLSSRSQAGCAGGAARSRRPAAARRPAARGRPAARP